MGSIYRHATVAVPASRAWRVLEEYARGEDRIFSVIEKVEMNGQTRVITTRDGQVLHERLIAVDPANRRVAYTIPGFAGADHHHAAMQVLEAGPDECVVVWVTDVSPDSVAESIVGIYDDAFPELVRAFSEV